MSNLKGAILATAIFVAVVFPFLLMISIDTFQQHAFLKVTEEVTELVKEEGGVSEQVTLVTDRLNRNGYTVTFSQPGLVKFGEEIVIGYKYEYQNVRGKKKLDVEDKVIIMKRSTGKGKDDSSGPPDPIEIAKAYSAKTPESLQPDKEYTFTVPGLTNLKSVTANMGNVEVVRVDGEKVTVKVSGGNVVRTVQTGGTNIPADEKYVTGEDSPDYSKEGYTGKLEKYLYSGSLLAADSKQITDIKTSLLSTNFPGSTVYAMNGYSGILTKNGGPIRRAIAGEFSPADTKWVDDAAAEDYRQDGYTGKLERYLKSGQLIPEEKKWIDGASSAVYNQNGFKGTLEKYVVSGTYIPGDSMYVQGHHSSYYNQNGYVGDLEWYVHEEYVTASTSVASGATCPSDYSYNGRGIHLVEQQPGWGSTNCIYGGWIWEEKYKGIVTKPGIDTRVYAYRGYVTKPEQDTRIYAYKGYVNKPAVDTRIYEYVQNYTGTVTRPETDTRIYKYRGKVIRPSSDSRTYENYYQYELNFQYT